MNQPLRSYLAELIGTFTLVFMGTAVATLSGLLDMGAAGWLGVSLAFGFTLTVLVLVVGPASGCHVNPAVTIPMAIAGRLKWVHVPGYLIAQCLGAICASGVLLLLLKGLQGQSAAYELATHGLGANGNLQEAKATTLFGFELVMTALFLFTILAATRSDTAPGFAAIAIGGFLFVAHLVGAPLGDASLNPARSLGPAVFEGADAMGILWIFLIGPFAGGIIGFVLYQLTYSQDKS